MIKKIARRPGGVFAFKEGILYSIVHSLEAEGLIESYWLGKEGSRQRKYYRLTRQGKQALAARQQEWVTFRSAVDKILTMGVSMAAAGNDKILAYINEVC